MGPCPLYHCSWSPQSTGEGPQLPTVPSTAPPPLKEPPRSRIKKQQGQQVSCPLPPHPPTPRRAITASVTDPAQSLSSQLWGRNEGLQCTPVFPQIQLPELSFCPWQWFSPGTIPGVPPYVGQPVFLASGAQTTPRRPELSVGLRVPSSLSRGSTSMLL